MGSLHRLFIAHYLQLTSRRHRLGNQKFLIIRSNDMIATSDATAELESRIRLRTGGRIRALEVQFDQERIVIYGEAPTYYAIQIATAAVLDLFPNREIVNAIELS